MQKYFRHCEHAFSYGPVLQMDSTLLLRALLLRPRAQSSRQKLLMAFAHWFEQDWGSKAALGLLDGSGAGCCVQYMLVGCVAAKVRMCHVLSLSLVEAVAFFESLLHRNFFAPRSAPYHSPEDVLRAVQQPSTQQVAASWASRRVCHLC